MHSAQKENDFDPINPADLDLSEPPVDPIIARLRELSRNRVRPAPCDEEEEQRTQKQPAQAKPSARRPAGKKARAHAIPPVILPEKHTYGQLPRWLDRSGCWGQMSGMARGVYGVMAMRANTHTGECRMPTRDLAEALGVSDGNRDRDIGGALDDLVALGAIEDTGRRHRRATIWRLVRTRTHGKRRGSK